MVYYEMSAPVKFLKNNWRDFKGKTFSHKCQVFVEGKGLVDGVELITISGIGKEAIQYYLGDNEHDKKYARYDDGKANGLVTRILTSPEAGETKFWNKEVISNIIAQKYCCKEHKFPHFAPKDGFCWSCGNQIYTRISWDEARNEPITGCPHCHRSYCD